MKTTVTKLAVLALALWALACSGDKGDKGGAAKCVEGATQECVCAGGAKGAQTCNAKGAFDACVCGDKPAAAEPAPGLADDEEQPELPPVKADAEVKTGAVDQDATLLGSFFYDWSGTRLGFQYSDDNTQLEITTGDGDERRLVYTTEVNITGKTTLVVKPIDGGGLGVALVTWDDDVAEVDFALELRKSGDGFDRERVDGEPTWAIASP